MRGEQPRVEKGATRVAPPSAGERRAVDGGPAQTVPFVLLPPLFRGGQRSQDNGKQCLSSRLSDGARPLTAARQAVCADVNAADPRQAAFSTARR